MEIYVNGVDISSMVGNWQDVHLSQVLTKETGKLEFNIRIYGSRALPRLGDQVDLYVNDHYYHYFGGTVTEIEIVNAGGLLLVAKIIATDWSYRLDSKLVATSYELMDPQDIILDIIQNYTDGYFTTDGVQRGNFLVPSIKFNYMPVTKAIQKLATLIGWDWNVDADRDVQFFLTQTKPAPFDIDDTSGNQEWPTLDWDQDLTNMKNSVFVIGANYKKSFDASTTHDVYTSVAGTFVYPLAYPYDMATLVVTLGGVSKTIGTDQSTPDASAQVQYNDKGRFIRFTSDPGAGAQIKVYGDALIPILAHGDNPAAIAQYGEIQDSIVDKQITTVGEAQMRAQAEIALYGSPTNTLSFTTVQPGLFVGMQIEFNSAVFQAIYGSASVTMSIRRIEAVGYSPFGLRFQVECYQSGSEVVSFVDIMSLLLQEENSQNPVEDSTVLQDLVPVDESIAVADAVTVTGSVSPYVWGPGMPQKRWGFSRWS